mgnify:CR=1 FL=1
MEIIPVKKRDYYLNFKAKFLTGNSVSGSHTQKKLQNLNERPFQGRS